jgi:hypothetical protein
VNYIFKKTQSSWNPSPNILEPDRAQHDCSAVCVIAQQYSSTTLISLHFNSHKEKFSARFKIFLFNLFYFLFETFVSGEVSAQCSVLERKLTIRRYATSTGNVAVSSLKFCSSSEIIPYLFLEVPQMVQLSGEEYNICRPLNTRISIQRILHKSLNFHSFQVMAVQDISNCVVCNPNNFLAIYSKLLTLGMNKVSSYERISNIPSDQAACKISCFSIRVLFL